MAIPNALKEFDNQLVTAVNQTFGSAASGSDWGPGNEDNNKNKYSVSRFLQQNVTPEDIRNAVEMRLNAQYGAVMIGPVTFEANKAQARGQKYQVIFTSRVYLASSNVRQQQLKPESRIIYEMVTDLTTVIMDNPIKIAKNPPLYPNFQSGDIAFSDKDYDVYEVMLEIFPIIKQ